MTDVTQDPDGQPRRSRTLPLVILVAVALLVVAIIVFVVVRTPGAPVSGSTPSTGASASSHATSAAPSAQSSGGPTSTKPTATTSRPPTSSPTKPPGSPTPQSTRSPVPIKTPAEVKPGLTVAITKIEAVKGEADGPGEIAGPAVRFVLTLTNNGSEELPLGNTVVNLYYGKAKTPATELHKPGGDPLPASVPAGGTATGTFLFQVDTKDRANVLITVDYSVDVSIVAFRGKAPS